MLACPSNPSSNFNLPVSQCNSSICLVCQHPFSSGERCKKVERRPVIQSKDTNESATRMRLPKMCKPSASHGGMVAWPHHCSAVCHVHHDTCSACACACGHPARISRSMTKWLFWTPLTVVQTQQQHTSNALLSKVQKSECSMCSCQSSAGMGDVLLTLATATSLTSATASNILKGVRDGSTSSLLMPSSEHSSQPSQVIRAWTTCLSLRKVHSF
jgi:hypothetical protein